MLSLPKYSFIFRYKQYSQIECFFIFLVTILVSQTAVSHLKYLVELLTLKYTFLSWRSRTPCKLYTVLFCSYFFSSLQSICPSVLIPGCRRCCRCLSCCSYRSVEKKTSSFLSLFLQNLQFLRCISEKLIVFVRFIVSSENSRKFIVFFMVWIFRFVAGNGH